MRYTKKLFVLFFAAFLFIGSAVISTEAQRRSARFIYRPVVVSPYYGWGNRFWYGNYWGNSYFGDPFFSDPYLNARRQKFYLQEELRGNRRELAKHLEKYKSDGVISAKERKELDDDYKDVAKAERKLREFNNDYAE